jgi:O-antigen/teichoic acid export membrane protein|tara:strand:- start:4648 stop:6177 length:1530 start_codon:yes stop_codon:yes gene_type:complete
MKVADKVIFNTGVLYAQLIIGMVIGLFTTRLVLNALGETNYGIYMLVAGVVGMLGVLNSNMTNTSMRYMAHSFGTGDQETLLKTFNTTLFLHISIGLIVILIMEVGGFFMFDYLLNIPEDKIYDAKVIFQFMVLTTFVTVVSVPYDAVINSHENIIALSLVDILGFVLKLSAAIYLTYSETNLLILYGFMLLVIQVLLRVIKQQYSRFKYDECKIRFRQYVDRDLMKSILNFTGWNLFGSIGALSVIQVRGVLLNMFFGVTLNAAEGISRTASSQIDMVSVSMTRAINPQLIKSEGSGDRKRMLRITEISTKFSVFLFALFAIPFLLEANYLLHLWLKEVPEYAVAFFQITLIAMFIEKFTFSITDSIRAIGEIRNFQTTETFFRVLNIPLAYFAFKFGYSAIAIYIIGAAISCIVFGNRLYFGKKIAGINISNYMRNAIKPILIPFALALSLSTFVHFNMNESFSRLFLVTFIFMIILTITFWLWALKDEEKNKFKEIALSTYDRFKK